MECGSFQLTKMIHIQFENLSFIDGLLTFDFNLNETLQKKLLDENLFYFHVKIVKRKCNRI
jgi:hypothetical protein